MAGVKMRPLAAVLVAFILVSCAEPVPQLPILADATEVRITVNGDGAHPIATIADPTRVAILVEFVNARRSGWETPVFGVPIPAITAQFCDGTKYKGHFGAGRTFFETNRGCVFCSRHASSQEVADFIALLEVDPGYLDINYKRRQTLTASEKQ